MVEGARLESVCRGNSTEGSNPSLSAIRRWSETRRSDPGVRARPTRREIGDDLRRGSPTPLEGLLEAEQRPAIAWMFLEIGAIHLFRILETLALEEGGPEPVVGGERQGSGSS